MIRHDNTSVHNAVTILSFSAKKQISKLHHARDSPDLAPIDFSKIKTVINERRFSVVSVTEKHVFKILKTGKTGF